MENRGSKLARAHPMNNTHNLKQNPAAALGKLKKDNDDGHKAIARVTLTY